MYKIVIGLIIGTLISGSITINKANDIKESNINRYQEMEQLLEEL